MKQRKEFQKLLSERKLKKTSQRALIWGVLLETKGHPSVEEIRESLIAEGHRIGLATIYRTIKILLASGLVRQSKLHGMVLMAGCSRNCKIVEILRPVSASISARPSIFHAMR